MGKSFLILPGCDDKNRGDQALIWETVEIAEKAGYEGQFYMLAEEDCSSQSKAVGIKNFVPIFKHPSRKNSGKDNVKYSILLTLRWGITSVSDMLCCEPLVHKGFRKIIKFFLKNDVKKASNCLNGRTPVLLREADFSTLTGDWRIHIKYTISCIISDWRWPAEKMFTLCRIPSGLSKAPL